MTIYLGVGHARKGIHDSSIKQNYEPILGKFLKLVPYYFTTSNHSRHIIRVRRGSANYYVDLSLKTEVVELSMDILGKVPEVIIELVNSDEVCQTNYTIYLSDITEDEFLMLKLSI